MAGSQKQSDFTVNAAAATGKFRVQPHLGQCQSADGVHSASLTRTAIQTIEQFRPSMGE